MKAYEATATIAADPDTVWAILTDGSGYTTWDSGVDRLEGPIVPGGKVRVTSSANPGRTFPVTVTEVTPPRSMTWSGGMPLGLFRGVRTFTLVADGDRRTRFTVREEYTGPLLPLIWRSMPDLARSFEQFATGLKRHAERTA